MCYMIQWCLLVVDVLLNKQVPYCMDDSFTVECGRHQRKYGVEATSFSLSNDTPANICSLIEHTFDMKKSSNLT